MKKTLVAVAALAAVGGASAQVTISGYFGASYDSFSISNLNAGRLGGYNTSEDRVSDQSSRIIFNVTEDLGSGLEAIGQFDLRFKVDATSRVNNDSNVTVVGAYGSAATMTAAANAPAGAGINYSPSVDQVSGGNSHVGIRSKDWGAIRLGRQDIYYTETASLLPGGLFLAANQAPIMHLPVATSSNGTMANWSRTPNLAWWESNRVSGFQATLGYSTGATRKSGTNEVENDIGTNGRKGAGTYVKLNYANGPIDATFATISLKSDYIGANAQTGALSTAAGLGAGNSSVAFDQMNNAVPDQVGTVLTLKYTVSPQLKLGLAYSDNKATTVSTGATTQAKAQGFSAQYALGGNHFITANHARRGASQTAGVENAGSDAQQTTLAYHYDFSKRTAAGLMWTQIKNGVASSTAMFYQGNNAYGGQGSVLNGETTSMISAALRHNF